MEETLRYVAPTSVSDAAEFLAAGDARVFAGATDLIPQIRSGRPEPAIVVDLKKISRLTSLQRSGNTWTIGAATPVSMIAENLELCRDLPGIAEAAALIGSDQIQNRATLGGNLCNGSPAADTVPALAVNNSMAVIASNSGTRVIPVADVVTGPGTTSLDPNELLVEFLIDRMPSQTADAYLRLTPRTEMDIAIVGAAVRISLGGDGSCTDAAIALGAVAPTVVRVPTAEAELIGNNFDEETLAAAATAASRACDPIDDKRGTRTYRRHVAGVLVRRSILIAAERAGEER